MSSYFKDGFSNVFEKPEVDCAKREEVTFSGSGTFSQIFLFIFHDHLSQLNCDNASLLFDFKVVSIYFGQF